jgi:hypothetical protein
MIRSELEMAELHVVSALAKKHAELSGDIEITQAKLRQMILDLESLDKTLLMFDPDYRIETIKPKAFRPPEDWSKRGEMTRIILGILRQASARFPAPLPRGRIGNVTASGTAATARSSFARRPLGRRL